MAAEINFEFFVMVIVFMVFEGAGVGYTLLTPASTYVVLAANLNDFRSLAKKYVPKNLVGEIKAMVLENGHKYYKEPLQDDEQVDGTVEYLDDSQQDDSYEVTREFTTTQQPKNRYQSKKAPKVALVEMSSPIAPTGLRINDIVEKVKQRLFHQSVNAQSKSQAGDSLGYENFKNKSTKVTETKAEVANPVYKSVPMKVIKEEVQFEATYEDLLDKDLQPQIQYSGQYLQRKPASVYSNSKNVSPKKKFVNTQYGGGVKKVRLVKQLLVPASSNQGQTAYVPQPSIVLQPMQKVSLGTQPSIVQHSKLEPQLTLMQQPSMVQKPMYLQFDHQADIDQSTIMKQLVLIQQQIEQLNRTAQQKELKNKRAKSTTTFGIPQLNIEAVEVNFVPNPAADVKTNDGYEEQAELSNQEVDKSVLSDETTEPSTKALAVSGTVDNEQLTRRQEYEAVEDSAGTVENDENVRQEKSPAETKESVSNEEKDTRKEVKTVKRKYTNLDANSKVHTQEFGNPDAGEPIVAKTYNFDEPNAEPVEADMKPVNLEIRPNSARKVMLF